uniref:Uncharacterized protein n=1 Tax=viral metagenome TaxID=1070528 RepID=A0A6M3XX68_9ZZZZ
MSEYGFEDPQSSADFLPIVKINCQSGRIVRVDRQQNADGMWDKTEVDISQVFQFLPDFTHLEIGHIKIDDNGIDFHMQSFADWSSAGRSRKPPAEGYRFGFRVPILLAKTCAKEPDDVRHLSHVGISVREGISRIYADYQQQMEQNPRGLLPLVKVTRFVHKQRGRFKNYEPEFEVIKWIERPDVFDEALAPEVDEEPDIPPMDDDDDSLPF